MELGILRQSRRRAKDRGSNRQEVAVHPVCPSLKRGFRQVRLAGRARHVNLVKTRLCGRVRRHRYGQSVDSSSVSPNNSSMDLRSWSSTHVL